MVVEVGDAGCELVEEELEFGGEEGFREGCEEGFEVVFEEVENEEYTEGGGFTLATTFLQIVQTE